MNVVLRILADRPVAYHPDLARAVGSVKACIFLCQLLYWSARTTNGDGWIWKTIEEMEKETALNRREQETARKVLRKLGVIEEKVEGSPPRRHFRIVEEKLIQLLEEFYGLESPTLNLAESDKSICTKVPNQFGRKCQFESSTLTSGNSATPTETTTSADAGRHENCVNNTEITTEITIYAGSNEPAQAPPKGDNPVKDPNGKKEGGGGNGEGEGGIKYARLFYHIIKRETGVEYREYGKLVKLARKWEEYCEHLRRRNGWTEERVLFLTALIVLWGVEERGSADPTFLFGKPAEVHVAIRRWAKRKSRRYEELKQRALEYVREAHDAEGKT